MDIVTALFRNNETIFKNHFYHYNERYIAEY